MSRLETLPDVVISKLRRQEFTIGEIIGGRYRLKSLLGVGAMGQVFVAENMAISVEVAVKLLKPELIANQEFRQRFQKEAEAIGSVNHQNVARFLDLVVGDPTFLVMEYARGPTLQKIIEQETRIPYDRALHIAARLCWGLEAAHSRGIVHRDLKPANIIVSSDVESGDRPVIIDFGLAKLATASENVELTRTGQIVGTPEYMAPEQIEGKKVDARADVYALGCVLYKMIAGRSPFGSESDVQILYRQLHEKPRPLTQLIPDLPPKIVEVLSRALAKDPDDRYANTREFAEAIGRAHDRRRSSGRMQPLPAAPVARRPPLALVAATTLAVGAVGGMLLGRLHSDASASNYIGIPTKDTVAPPPAASELLVIATEPAGATVEIDGKKLPGVTPAAVPGIEIGRHTVRLTAPGRSVIERKVTIAAGGHSALVVNMPPAQRSVIVRSVPSGAAVYLDRQLVGPAPATIVVSQDDFHELRLEKLGFAPLIRAIKPDDTEPELRLSMDLDPSPHSEVSVDSSAEAEIWLDGINTAVETPAMGLRVTPGRHTLQLRDSSGATSKKMTIEIKPGETLRVVMNL